MPTKKNRVSVPLSDDIYMTVKADAEATGMSIPTYCQMIIGNHYQQLKVSMNYAQDMISQMFGQMLMDKGITAADMKRAADETRADYNKSLLTHKDE